MKLKDLIGKYTTDGEVDFEKAEIDFQSHVNGIVTKNVKTEVGKKEAEVMGNFITELGIEANDLDGVKKWVNVMNNNSNDYKKTNVSLETKLTDSLKKHTDLQTKYTDFKQDTLISGLGVKSETAEFLKYKFNKGITEDVTFENQIDTYKKDNRITTNVEIQTNFEDHSSSSPLESLKKLREN